MINFSRLGGKALHVGKELVHVGGGLHVLDGGSLRTTTTTTTALASKLPRVHCPRKLWRKRWARREEGGHAKPNAQALHLKRSIARSILLSNHARRSHDQESLRRNDRN
jgi:hypothetical protein